MRIAAREKTVAYVILSVFALFAVVPLVGVVFSAVTPAAENHGAFALPTRIDLGNFATAWTEGMLSSYLVSSVLVTACVVVLTSVLAVLAGFAFARLDFAGSETIFFVLLAGLVLPAEAFVIPLYFNLSSVGLIDTYEALILPQTAQSLGFAVFWMRNHFRAFPDEIIEAARMDGASDLRVLFRVMVPSSVAPIVTMCVLVGMWTWNEFLLPLVLVTSEDHRTAPLGLAFFKGSHVTDYSLLSAGGVLVALPIVLAYVFLQKRFISGMLDGFGTR